MITLDPNELKDREKYKLLTGAIVPRPIAFVTTTSTVNGTVNAAPFSFFNIVSSDPPIISLSIGRRAGNTMKDTARNAVANGELVVHISTENLIEDINETAALLPAARSELELTGLNKVDSTIVSVPGILEAKVRFECRLEQHHEIKNDHGNTVTDFLMARIVCIHIDETVYDPQKGYVFTETLRPVARLAGSNYAELGKIYSLIRPE
ncbi:flavin reductase family protein [Siminovitchia terrae]|uniref:Flavin reductase family protein n=1 Tax=Siminovitchia terrae TaxID=1914933 RepID=A0A429X2Q2_SIMTE|nr:flavin reductase family protein [Siminovitchia terrae]RST57560.1 flavin reductase family protein [Siminovitchia terrae]